MRRIRKDVWDKTVRMAAYTCPACGGRLHHLDGEERGIDPSFRIGCELCAFAYEERGCYDDGYRVRLIERGPHEDS